MKGVGKAVGKQVLRTGAAVASDVLHGENVGKSVKLRGKQGARRLVAKGVRKVMKSQQGRGLGVRTRRTIRKTIKGARKPRKTTKKKKKSRADALGFF